ncbi:MAG: hypothetical protein N2738_07845 [Thermodesulfovibrionales bacterium]|nr:hypothetical protein [Thermodesulfovibrionales bacterium]
MPPVAKHLVTSKERTGKEYKEIHEWLDDSDAVVKAQRHDITKIFEYGKMFEEKYGEEGRQEYIQHIHDDIKAKFTHIEHDLQKAVADTLAYFGVK